MFTLSPCAARFGFPSHTARTLWPAGSGAYAGLWACHFTGGNESEQGHGEWKCNMRFSFVLTRVSWSSEKVLIWLRLHLTRIQIVWKRVRCVPQTKNVAWIVWSSPSSERLKLYSPVFNLTACGANQKWSQTPIPKKKNVMNKNSIPFDPISIEYYA